MGITVSAGLRFGEEQVPGSHAYPIAVWILFPELGVVHRAKGRGEGHAFRGNLDVLHLILFQGGRRPQNQIEQAGTGD